MRSELPRDEGRKEGRFRHPSKKQQKMVEQEEEKAERLTNAVNHRYEQSGRNEIECKSVGYTESNEYTAGSTNEKTCNKAHFLSKTSRLRLKIQRAC